MPQTELARKLAALERLGLRRGSPQLFDKAVRQDRDSWRVTSGRPALGSFVDLTVIDRSADRANEAIAFALAELERLRAVFDRHDSTSALSALNAAGSLTDAPRELTSLLAQSRRYSVASDAAFDVTVAPLVDLFRAAGEREPSDGEVAERRALVGYAGLTLERRRVAFARSGMSVTLDAIAKGAIVDAMARMLERHGVKRWLVDAGGDIRASDSGARGEPWTVAVRDPAADATLPETISLRGGAVATSGSYAVMRRGSPAPREIVHGALGEFPQDCASVTVLAPSTTAADALATTVVALGPRAGMALIERLRCACLIVLPDGSRSTSGHWKELTS